MGKLLMLSPQIASTTLIAFSNGAPEIIASFNNSEKSEGTINSIAMLLGGYIFCLTLIVSSVYFNSKDKITLPKASVIKELIFYFLSMLVIAVFGYFGSLNIWFMGIFICIYVLYIVITIIISHW